MVTPTGPGQFLPSLDAPRRRWRELSFAVRLFAGLGATLLLVGAAAFVLLTERLEQHEIESFARVQRADARGFEELAREHDRRIAVREIGQVLDAIGRRPGMIDASLIDPRGIVVASSRESLVGTPHRTEQIMQALRRGAERYGRAEDPGEESSAFEFVTPVGFPDARYAVEVGTDSESFDEQTAGIREVLALVLVLALVAISVLFYLLGGRSLLRSHRLALQRSTLDGLTDLPNQRAFQSDLEQAVALAARDNGPVALAVLDVDQFKLVNDRNGHIQGDALLKAIAAVLREGRSADRPYRIGGDEFALLLPNTDGDGACTVLRRLGRALAGAGASVSIGVATLRSGERSGELWAEADAALYEAKRRGGNRTVHFDELRGEGTVTTADKRKAGRRLGDKGRLTTPSHPIWDAAPPPSQIAEMERLYFRSMREMLSDEPNLVQIINDLQRILSIDSHYKNSRHYLARALLLQSEGRATKAQTRMPSRNSNEFQKLQEQLIDPDPVVRKSVVMEFIQYGEDAVDPLIALLMDEDADVRVHAAAATDERDVDAIVGAENAPLRRRHLWRLSRRLDPAARDQSRGRYRAAADLPDEVAPRRVLLRHMASALRGGRRVARPQSSSSQSRRRCARRRRTATKARQASRRVNPHSAEPLVSVGSQFVHRRYATHARTAAAFGVSPVSKTNARSNATPRETCAATRPGSVAP